MRKAVFAAIFATVAVMICGCATLDQDRARNELARGQLDEAASDVTAALGHDPDNPKLKNLAAEIFTQRGVQHYKAGEMTAAADDFHRAIGYDPRSARAYEYLGVIAYQQHDWQDAIDYGDKGASLEGKPDPEYVGAARRDLQSVRSGFKPYRVR